MAQDVKVPSFETSMLLGFNGSKPLISFRSKPQKEVEARTIITLIEADIGAELAVIYENGDPQKPLIIGRILEEPKASSSKDIAEDVLRLEAAERIELKVGNSTVILEKDGHITIRGDEVVSHAKGANTIRGGSIKLN